MPLNEYDDLLGTGAAEPSGGTNEYTDIIDGDREEQKTVIQGAMLVAAETQPDRKAEVLKMADRLKIPASVVERNYDTLSKKDAIAQNDYDSIIDNDPKLAKWLEDPDQAAVSHDDIDGLRGIERTAQDHGMKTIMYGALGTGLARMNSSLAKTPAFALQALYWPQNLAADLLGMEDLKVQVPESWINNPVSKYYDKAAKEFTDQYAPVLNESVFTELRKGDFDRAGTIMAAQLVANAPQQAMLILSAVSGVGAFGLGAAGATTAAQKYGETIDPNQPEGTPQVSPEMAMTNALTHGVVEAGFESLGTFGILKSWEKALTKELGKQTARETIVAFTKQLSKAIATEGNEEAFTSAAQDFSDYVTGVNPNALTGIAQRAIDAGLIGAASGGVMTSPSAIGAAVVKQTQPEQSIEFSGKAVGAPVEKSRQAQMQRDFYLKMGDSIEASKLKQRLPEAQQRYVESIVKDSPVEKIYIPVEAIETFFQSQNIPPSSAMQKLGATKSYEEAKATGGDVEVPLASWSSKLDPAHYKGLADDIKFNPNDLTVNETRRANDQARAQLSVEDKKAEEQAQAEQELEPDTTQVNQEELRKKQSEAIRNKVLDQLKTSGMDSKSAEANAQVMEAVFKTLGERAGINPLELFSNYGLEIQGPNQPVQDPDSPKTLNQELAAMKPQKGDEVTQDISLGERVLKQSALEDALYQVDRNDDEFGVTVNEGTEGSAIELSQDYGWWFSPNESEAKKIQETLPYSNPAALQSITVNPKEQGKGTGSKILRSIITDAKSNGNDALFVNASPLGTKDAAKDLTKKDDLIRFYEKHGFKIHEEHAEGAVMILDLRGDSPLFQGGPQDPRGQIRISGHGINIDLLKKADLSTFLHETGHFYLEVLGDLAKAPGTPDQIKQDYQAMLDWLGVKPGEKISTEQHEQAARGFEAYFMEGKAPSENLREVFTRFKVWLIQIYQRLTNLNVELTDEVRGVFARMLATDADIARAQAEQNQEPLFKDPSQFGMTGEKAERYTKAIEDSKFAAESKLQTKMMDDILREKKAFWREEKEKIEKEITKQLNNQEVYQAISILQKGKLPNGTEVASPLKLDKKELIKQFGDDIISKLPRGISTQEGGLHPDVAAESLKYHSGRELVEAMLKAPPYKQAIAISTEARMNELYPEFYKDVVARSNEAMKDIHSDERVKVLRMELEHLAEQHLPVLKDVIRRVARRVPTDKIVRTQADRIINNKEVKNIKPSIYQAAERKAAKEAGDFLAKGDLEGAFRSKQKELLNHELYRSAVEALEDVDKQLVKFKKIAKTTNDVAKTRDMDLVNAAKAVLASYGIGKVDKSVYEYLKPIEKYAPDIFETMAELVDNAIATSGFALSYKDIPYDSFQTLSTSVEALWDLSKRSKQIELDGKKVDRDEQIQLLQNRISEITSTKDRTKYTQSADKWDKAKLYLMGSRASLRRVESWVDAIDDGDPNGEFRRTLWNPIAEGTTKYRGEKRDYIQKYLDIIKGIESTLSYDEIQAPELGHKFKGKAELLHAILHTGNISNKTKLLQGWGWGQVDEDGVLDTSKWDAFIKRAQESGILTKADYDYAQATWNLLEELKTPAQQSHKDMYGHYFGEISAESFITPFGEYKGGYVPAIADPFLVEDQNIRNEKESLEKSNNSFMFPTSGRGFTKKRVEAYTVPLALDLRYIPMHIDKVLRFIHIEPRVKDVGRIVMNKGFRKSLAELDPTIGGDMLVPWLQRAAQQKVVSASTGWGGKAVDTLFREIRTRTGLNVMVGNVVNTLQQTTGLSIAALKVEPRYLRNALWSYTRAPKKLAQMVNEKSKFMNTRTGTQTMEIQQTIDDLLLDPSKYEKARAFANKHGYFMQQSAQNMVDLITWTGAYDQAVEKGAPEKNAVLEADSAVRLTQGSFNAEDVSKFETGTPFMRAFTMFYSYFNMQANLLASEFIKVIRGTGLRKGAGRALYIYVMGLMIPAVLGDLIVRAMSGKGLDEDDDDQYLDDIMTIFFSSQLRNATAFFPGIGQAVNAGFNAWNDKYYDDRISTSPAVSMIESAVSAPVSVYNAIAGEGTSSKAIRDSLTAIGLLSGLPVAPLARPIGYLTNIAEGNVEPSGPIDFTRGLVTGKSGSGK